MNNNIDKFPSAPLSLHNAYTYHTIYTYIYVCIYVECKYYAYINVMEDIIFALILLMCNSLPTSRQLGLDPAAAGLM